MTRKKTDKEPTETKQEAPKSAEKPLYPKDNRWGVGSQMGSKSK